MAESVRRKRIQTMKQMIELEKSLSVNETLLSKERIQIVEMKSMELLANLKNGVLSAVDVLHAFQAKALDVTKRINCITEFIPEAESWAKECDLVPVEERGPLHGIPVSIKDCVNIKGVDTTLGLTKLAFNPAASNALIIDVLLENGAVPFCKTNIPQTMYSIGCSNPVFGTTSNPYDILRSCGGSSGGEGALIAAGGSVLGLGTDIGGSIRLPASLSGCVGIKPSASRLSTKGVRKINAGLKGVESAIGPMGRDVEIVVECMKAISGDKMSKRDSFVVPVPWNELTMTSKLTLKFGYFDSIDMFPTTPGVKRAIHVAKKALEESGHIVIPFKLDMWEMTITATHIFGSDEGKSLSNFFNNGEIIEPLMLKGIKQSTTPSYKKPLERYIKSKTSKLSSKFIFSSKLIQTSEYWKSLYQRQEKIDELIKRFRENNIDLLLSPTFPIPAPTKETIANFLCGVMYTMPFNYLDFPSGTLPVTHETEEDQKMLQNYPEDDSLLKLAKESTQGGVGLPLGVMITGLPLEEELVCKGMMELQEALKASSPQ